MNTARRIRICGTGSSTPANAVTSDTLDRHLALKPGSVLRSSGVKTRFHAVQENAAQLAARACEEALASAGLEWKDIDCLVATSATMDQALPFNAALVLAEASATTHKVAAFDVGASCMSFLVGLDTLSYLVDAGRYRHVMFVSSDIASFALNWTSLEESAIFGDGAAAAIIRRSGNDEASRMLSSRIQTYAAGAEHCQIKAGGSRHHPKRCTGDFEDLATFHMDGRRLFKLVAKELPPFVESLLADASIDMADIDLVVPHQASRLAIDHLVKRLGITSSRMIDVFERFGNQVGASLPSAMHHAIKDSKIDRGQSMLLIGSGAGVTLGGIVMVY